MDSTAISTSAILSPDEDVMEELAPAARSGAACPSEACPNLEHLITLVYPELRRIAGALMRRERQGHTLQPTAIVNEAILKVLDSPISGIRDDRHFVTLISKKMRHLLVSYARRRDADKRNPAACSAGLFSQNLINLEQTLAVESLMDRYEAIDPRAHSVVVHHYFFGFTIQETAAIMDLSPATIERNWSAAKAWLYGELFS